MLLTSVVLLDFNCFGENFWNSRSCHFPLFFINVCSHFVYSDMLFTIHHLDWEGTQHYSSTYTSISNNESESGKFDFAFILDWRIFILQIISLFCYWYNVQGIPCLQGIKCLEKKSHQMHHSLKNTGRVKF